MGWNWQFSVNPDATSGGFEAGSPMSGMEERHVVDFNDFSMDFWEDPLGKDYVI